MDGTKAVQQVVAGINLIASSSERAQELQRLMAQFTIGDGNQDDVSGNGAKGAKTNRELVTISTST